MVKIVAEVTLPLNEHLEELIEGAVLEVVLGHVSSVIEERHAAVVGVPGDVDVFCVLGVRLKAKGHVGLNGSGAFHVLQSVGPLDFKKGHLDPAGELVSRRGVVVDDVVYDMLHPRGATFGIAHNEEVAWLWLVTKGGADALFGKACADVETVDLRVHWLRHG